jgi:outer membrane receptor for ferrienterochelin and colicins
VSAAVYNLLNKSFIDYRIYNVPGAAAQAGNVYRNPQEGRRLWVSANYEF